MTAKQMAAQEATIASTIKNFNDNVAELVGTVGTPDEAATREYIAKEQAYLTRFEIAATDPRVAESVATLARLTPATRSGAISDPATGPQISYLRRLGYRGTVSDLTKADASRMIDARKRISAEDNDDFDEIFGW